MKAIFVIAGQRFAIDTRLCPVLSIAIRTVLEQSRNTGRTFLDDWIVRQGVFGSKDAPIIPADTFSRHLIKPGDTYWLFPRGAGCFCPTESPTAFQYILPPCARKGCMAEGDWWNEPHHSCSGSEHPGDGMEIRCLCPCHTLASSTPGVPLSIVSNSSEAQAVPIQHLCSRCPPKVLHARLREIADWLCQDGRPTPADLCKFKPCIKG